MDGEGSPRLAGREAPPPGGPLQRGSVPCPAGGREGAESIACGKRGQTPKTHSIERLLSLLEQHIDANEFYEIEVDVLTDYAVETRYPGPFLDHDEATYAVEVAERAVELASRLLGERNIRCKE